MAKLRRCKYCLELVELFDTNFLPSIYTHKNMHLYNQETFDITGYSKINECLDTNNCYDCTGSRYLGEDFTYEEV